MPERIIGGNRRWQGRLVLGHNSFVSFPDWIEPMAATLTQERFTGPEWIFERKSEGICLLAFRRDGRPTPLCWKDVCSNTPNSSDARRSAWRRIPDSSQPLTNPKPSKWGSAGFRFPATTPKAPLASSGRSSLGSKSFRNGAQAVKAASVFSNADMGCGDPFIKDRTASGAGSDSG